MKRIFLCILIFLMILPSLSLAQGNRVLSLGILGQGGANLEAKLTRDQLATLAVRLMGMEYFKDSYNKKGQFNDVKGWALPYVNIAYENNILSGVSNDKFNPNGDVTYIQLLTLLMRLLGYKDNIDFHSFPDDYYNKALEIGLADLYIPHDKVINRGIVVDTIEKFLDLKLRDMDISYYDYMEGLLKAGNLVVNPPKENNNPKKLTMENISFNTSIVGSFSGQLKGASDFSQYKIGLYSGKGDLYKMVNLNKDGKFTMSGFDISIIAKLGGYEYRIYDKNMNILLSDKLN